jgi:hypothetical protein
MWASVTQVGKPLTGMRTVLTEGGTVRFPVRTSHFEVRTSRLERGTVLTELRTVRFEVRVSRTKVRAVRFLVRDSPLSEGNVQIYPAGNQHTTSVPPPSLPSMRRWPPWPSTISRQRGRPRPEPPGLEV